MSIQTEENIPLEILEIAMPEAWLQPKNLPTPQELEYMEKRIGQKFIKVGGFRAGVTEKQIESTKIIKYEPTNLYPCHDVDHATVRMRYHVRICGREIINKKGERTGCPEVLGEFMCDVDKFVKDYKPV